VLNSDNPLDLLHLKVHISTLQVCLCTVLSTVKEHTFFHALFSNSPPSSVLLASFSILFNPSKSSVVHHVAKVALVTFVIGVVVVIHFCMFERGAEVSLNHVVASQILLNHCSRNCCHIWLFYAQQLTKAAHCHNNWRALEVSLKQCCVQVLATVCVTIALSILKSINQVVAQVVNLNSKERANLAIIVRTRCWYVPQQCHQQKLIHM